MRKRSVYLILLAVLMVGLVLAVCRRAREPAYGGQRLSEWVNTQWLHSAVSVEEATDALHHMGNKALPRLMRWIQYDSPVWKQKLFAVSNRITQGLHFSFTLSDDKTVLRGNHAMM